jgi:hypothetical protein
MVAFCFCGHGIFFRSLFIKIFGKLVRFCRLPDKSPEPTAVGAGRSRRELESGPNGNPSRFRVFFGGFGRHGAVTTLNDGRKESKQTMG